MPNFCGCCGRWFQPQPCCNECDKTQKFNVLCGSCCGIGPYTKEYYSSMSTNEAAAIQAHLHDHTVQRKIIAQAAFEKHKQEQAKIALALKKRALAQQVHKETPAVRNVDFEELPSKNLKRVHVG